MQNIGRERWILHGKGVITSKKTRSKKQGNSRNEPSRKEGVSEVTKGREAWDCPGGGKTLRRQKKRSWGPKGKKQLREST